MDKVVRNAQIVVSYESSYAVVLHNNLPNVTELDALNQLCKDAAKDGKIIVKASIKMVDSIGIYGGRNNFEQNKSL